MLTTDGSPLPNPISTAERLEVRTAYSPQDCQQFVGQLLTPAHYDRLLTRDADVFDADTGAVVLRFRKSVLEAAGCRQAWRQLRQLDTKTGNRGLAIGKGLMRNRRLADGTASKTREVPRELAVRSNVIGFYDRYTRTPFCRQTAFNANQPEGFRLVLPFLQDVSRWYGRLDAERWAVQQAVVARTHPDFVIPGTVFTTVTVNKNFRTAVHTDEGDLKAGLSCITALCAGEFTGGFLVFPHYRLAVDLQTADLLLFDSHHMHGNTALCGKVGGYERVSLVLYYREGMINCGSAAEELRRAQRRQRGQPLN